MKKYITGIILALLFSYCSNSNSDTDAWGNFEATEILLTAESSGKMLYFNANEGDAVDSGQIIACIDTVQLHLKKLQLQAQKQAVTTKFAGVFAQLDVLNQQKASLQTEKKRIEKLLADSAATQQQFDNINNQILVLDKQMEQVKVTNAATVNEVSVWDAQILQISDLIMRCVIKSPMQGILIKKYIEPYEVAIPGKALFKIADLKNMKLKVYVDQMQLSEIKIGDEVKIQVDNKANQLKTYSGIISNIANEAEFTPKIIQTRKERINLVYGLKINVVNDGYLKIGTPAEVQFLSKN